MGDLRLRLDAQSGAALKTALIDIEGWTESINGTLDDDALTEGYARLLTLKQTIESNPDIVGIVRHDLRNRMQVVFSGVFDEDSAFKDRFRRVDLLKKYVYIISGVVSSLLFWTAPEQEGLERINLTDLMKKIEPILQKCFLEEESVPTIMIDDDNTWISVSTAFKKTFSPSLQLIIEDGLEIQGHEGTILTLLMNIARNAMQHNVDYPDGYLFLHIIACREGDEVVLKIMDCGKGIDEESNEHIFDFGYSTGAGGNTGIGLAYAPLRMELMGGSIECYPTGGPRGGAKFVLRFKVA